MSQRHNPYNYRTNFLCIENYTKTVIITVKDVSIKNTSQLLLCMSCSVVEDFVSNFVS